MPGHPGLFLAGGGASSPVEDPNLRPLLLLPEGLGKVSMGRRGEGLLRWHCLPSGFLLSGRGVWQEGLCRGEREEGTLLCPSPVGERPARPTLGASQACRFVRVR